jgi:hypothetical protein
MKKQELTDALKEEWGKLDIHEIWKLIESMPRRLQSVIDKQGGSTSY